MKTKFKIIIWIIAVFLVIFIAANILIGIYAPRIVEQEIQQNLKLKTSLRKISLSLPFTVVLEGLELGDLATIKRISLSPNLIGLLFGKIIIHGLNITEPVINLVQDAGGKLNLPAFDQKQKAPEVFLTSLRVENGKIIFTDRKITPEGFQVIVNKLNVKVSKVTLPLTSLAANFKISAQLLNSGSKTFANIAFGGWIDYLAKDMDAKLEIKNLDVANFTPYYGNFISNRKVASATLNSDSTFESDHNDLEIITDFDLSGIVYQDAQVKESEPVLDLTDNALDLFADARGNLRLQFKINTRMDKPSLSRKEVMEIILKAALKNLASQSPQQIVDKVTSVIEKYKGMGKELKEIFGK